MRAVDFHAYLIEDEPDCAVSIDSVDYADLDGDGREEALVVASTCNTGTAGPDVHAVYRLDDAGKPVELEIDESASTFEGKTVCVRKEYTARLAALKAWHAGAGRRDQ